MKVRKSQSLQIRTLAYHGVIVGAAVACLTGLFLYEQRRAMDQQLLLRAAGMAEFLAAQTQFAMLVGDRAELNRLADSTLRTEDVMYVRFSGADGSRLAESAKPRAARPEAGDSLNIERPVIAPTDGVSDLDSAVRRTGSLGKVQIGVSTQKQRILFARSVRYASGVAILALALI